MPGNRSRELINGSLSLKSLTQLNKIQKPLHGVKCKKVSGISCFIQFRTEPKERKCHLKIFSRLRPGFKTQTISDIDPETFEIDKEIDKLQFSVFETPVEEVVPNGQPTQSISISQSREDGTLSPKTNSYVVSSPRHAGDIKREDTDRSVALTEFEQAAEVNYLSDSEYGLTLEDQQREINAFKGHLFVSTEEKSEKKFISLDPNDLFFKVPRKSFVFISGSQTKVTEVNFDFDQETSLVSINVQENSFEWDKI